MRWEDERESSNVDDLRGDGDFGGGGFGGFGGFGGPVMIGGGGLGAVILFVLALLFGGRPGQLAQGPGAASEQYQTLPGQAPVSGADDQDVAFVKKVTAMTEDTWSRIFADRGLSYTPPRVELYSGAHPTGCGLGQAAMGPFYCPNDQKVWLDLSFFRELSDRFGAPGRFAEAYVIAHEIGHHVQTLLGTTEKVDQAREAASTRAEANRLSVRTELQADCYAGVWANQTNRDRHFLDPGDVEQGLAAASAVGDDRLQQETQGRVMPDSFTHGTSAQRVRWFRRGFDSGDMDDCDTFSPSYASL